MKIRACLLLSCSVLLFVGQAGAAPVWGQERALKQPDGEMIQVRIWGDEFYQVVESVDGYTLIRDPETGVICYAALSQDGSELVSTGVRAGTVDASKSALIPHLRITSQSRAVKVAIARARLGALPLAKAGDFAPPCIGNVRGICLIIDFPDEAGTIPASEFDAFCNQPGYSGYGNNGSVRDYFYDCSGGRLTYTSFVPTAYYTAIHNKDYYDDPATPTGPRAAELIGEALQQLDNDGMDFSQFDSNGDGLVDAVNCLYVGYTSSGWSTGLWPHSGVMAFQTDGVTVLQYQISDMGDTLEIGTYCHENGHLICIWPDLYDYDHDSYGVGYWCLMANGNAYGTNPIQPSAFCKERAGWLDIVTLDGLHQTGLAATAGSSVAYRFPHPTLWNEYYLIENRQKTGRDARIPGSGLAIWHVDVLGNNSYNEMTPEHHYKVTLVQADGLWEMENHVNRGNAGDVWRSPDHVNCGPDTFPGTNWWDGSPSYLRVSNISVSGPTMTFDFDGLGSKEQDEDGDGISDYDEVRDLDPVTPGIQNPFDPLVADSTGDYGKNTPDGNLDGENDYDGDGTENALEFAYGSNPLDPASQVPVAGPVGLLVLAAGLALTARQRRRPEWK